MTLGERITLIRKDRGETQAEFAAQIGVSGKSEVSKYENDRGKPGYSTLLVIAELGYSLDWIAREMGQMKLSSNHEAEELHRQREERLIQLEASAVQVSQLARELRRII